MKRVLVVALVGFALASLTAAQTSQMLNTKHDLGTGSTGPSAAALVANNVDQICVFCHTPHQSTTANAQDPLWNHQFPAAVPAYGVYGSDTLDALPTEIGAAVGSASVSMLCMSCHDGSVGVGSLYNNPNGATGEITPSNSAATLAGVASSANLGTSLVDDHPVNFTYDAALVAADGGTGLATPASVDWVDAGNTVPLFNATVQCASCHDPHDATNIPFLVKDNANSVLCVTCHLK